MFCNVTIAGYVGREPEIRQTQKGTTIATMAVATKEGFGKDAKTIWHEVVFFGKAADIIAQWVNKGKMVLVNGTITVDEWVDKKSGEKRRKYKIKGSEIRFLPDSNSGGRQGGNQGNQGNRGGNQSQYQGGNQGNNQSQPPRQSQPRQQAQQQQQSPMPDDDIPF